MGGHRVNQQVLPGSDESRYQPLPEAILKTRFRSIHETIWEAEARFDLLFRQDHGLHVWPANRLRIYYQLAEAIDVYDAQKTAVAKPEAVPEYRLDDLPEVDVYIQTGALGPAAANRARPYGCTYTQDYVRWLLDHGHRVLLLSDAEDVLVKHPGLFVLHSRQLSGFSAQCKRGFGRREQLGLGGADLAFWTRVDDFFHERLGVRIFGREKIEGWIWSLHTQLVTQREVFRRVRPKAFICMAHYFRAAQIQAAREVGARTIDFQHGINSKFHLGYGFPNVRPEARDIPYYPDEFWSWGRFWAPESWFPTKCCDVRAVGHNAHAHAREIAASATRRQDRTLLIATSWAMQSAFKAAVEQIAVRLPDWQIVVKLHPREDLADYEGIAAAHANVSLVAGHMDVMEAARDVSVVLSICSSSLFDVLLVGGRIAVMHLEGVEYAEDFVAAFGIPVLDADASNIEACIEQALGQSLPLDRIFAGAQSERLELAMNAALGAAFPRPERITAAKVLGSNGNAQPRSLLSRLRDFARRRYSGGPSDMRFRYLTKAAKQAGEQRDDSAFAGCVAELFDLGAPTAAYRNRLLGALYRLKRTGDTATFQKGLDALLKKALTENATTALPLFEHALIAGKEKPLLKAYGLSPNTRRWREGAALLAGCNPTMASIVRSTETIVESAADEFLDARVSDADIERLVAHLKQRIADGKPFAMMRLGDGEVYGFDVDYVDRDTLDEDRAAREGIWWNATLDEPMRLRLRDGFAAAMAQADLLGIPSSFRLLRDLPVALDSMRRPIELWSRTTRAHVILFRELDRMISDGRVDLAGKAICDDRCHQELFTPERTRQLLSGAAHVVGVNCFARERLNKALGAEIIHDHVLLPPHQKVRQFVDDTPLRDMPTPFVLDELLARIDDVVRPGSVVLVAGGFAGKLLIGRARERGGVVLDIGAAADYWMGIDTRGELDFAAYR